MGAACAERRMKEHDDLAYPWFSWLAEDSYQLPLPVTEKILRPLIVSGFLVVVLTIFGQMRTGWFQSV